MAWVRSQSKAALPITPGTNHVLDEQTGTRAHPSLDPDDPARATHGNDAVASMEESLGFPRATTMSGMSGATTEMAMRQSNAMATDTERPMQVFETTDMPSSFGREGGEGNKSLSFPLCGGPKLDGTLLHEKPAVVGMRNLASAPSRQPSSSHPRISSSCPLVERPMASASSGLLSGALFKQECAQPKLPKRSRALGGVVTDGERASKQRKPALYASHGYESQGIPAPSQPIGTKSAHRGQDDGKLPSVIGGGAMAEPAQKSRCASLAATPLSLVGDARMSTIEKYFFQFKFLDRNLLRFDGLAYLVQERGLSNMSPKSSLMRPSNQSQMSCLIGRESLQTSQLLHMIAKINLGHQRFRTCYTLIDNTRHEALYGRSSNLMVSKQTPWILGETHDHFVLPLRFFQEPTPIVATSAAKDVLEALKKGLVHLQRGKRLSQKDMQRVGLKSPRLASHGHLIIQVCKHSQYLAPRARKWKTGLHA